MGGRSEVTTPEILEMATSWEESGGLDFRYVFFLVEEWK